VNPINQAASGLSSRGFVLLVVFVYGVLFAAALADVWLIVAGWWAKRTMQSAQGSGSGGVTSSKPYPPAALADYMNAFVKTRPWVAVALAILFGAMITHFFLYIGNQ
jgi:hypothetical protein